MTDVFSIDKADMGVLKKVGRLKVARAGLKMFKQFCPECKKLCVDNPRTPVHEYCELCQDKYREIFGALIK